MNSIPWRKCNFKTRGTKRYSSLAAVNQCDRSDISIWRNDEGSVFNLNAEDAVPESAQLFCHFYGCVMESRATDRDRERLFSFNDCLSDTFYGVIHLGARQIRPSEWMNSKRSAKEKDEKTAHEYILSHNITKSCYFDSNLFLIVRLRFYCAFFPFHFSPLKLSSCFSFAVMRAFFQSVLKFQLNFHGNSAGRVCSSAEQNSMDAEQEYQKADDDSWGGEKQKEASVIAFVIIFHIVPLIKYFLHAWEKTETNKTTKNAEPNTNANKVWGRESEREKNERSEMRFFRLAYLWHCAYDNDEHVFILHNPVIFIIIFVHFIPLVCLLSRCWSACLCFTWNEKNVLQLYPANLGEIFSHTVCFLPSN